MKKLLISALVVTGTFGLYADSARLKAELQHLKAQLQKTVHDIGAKETELALAKTHEENQRLTEQKTLSSKNAPISSNLIEEE